MDLREHKYSCSKLNSKKSMNEIGQNKTTMNSFVTNTEGEVGMNRTDIVDNSLPRGQLQAKDIREMENSQKDLSLQQERSGSNVTASDHVGISEQVSESALWRLTSSGVSQEWDSCSDCAEDDMEAEPPATQCLPSWKLKPAACTTSYQKIRSTDNDKDNSSTASQAIVGDGSAAEAAASCPDTIAGALDWIRCGASIVSSYLNWKRDGCKYSFSLPQFRDSAKLRQINTCSEVGRTRHRLPSSQRTQLRHVESLYGHDVGMQEECCEGCDYDSCGGDSYTNREAALRENVTTRVSKYSEMSHESVDGNDILSQTLLWQKPILQDSYHAPHPGKAESADILQTSEVWSGSRHEGFFVGSISLRDQGAGTSALGGNVPQTLETLQTPARCSTKDNHDASACSSNPKFMVDIDSLLTTSHLDGNALHVRHDPSKHCHDVERSKEPEASIFKQACSTTGWRPVDELVIETISSPASQTSVYGEVSRLQECDMVSIALDSEATQNDDADTLACSTPSPCSTSSADDHSSSSSEVMQAAMMQSASACFCWLGNPRRRDGGRSRSYIKERNALAVCKAPSQKHCKDSDGFCQESYKSSQYLVLHNEDQELQTNLSSGCNSGTKIVTTENQTGFNCHYTSEGCHENISNNMSDSKLMCMCQFIPTQLAKDEKSLDETLAASNMCHLHSAHVRDPHIGFVSFDEKRHALSCCSDASSGNCCTHTTSCSAQNTFKNSYLMKGTRERKPEHFSSCDINMCNSTYSVPSSLQHESDSPDSTGDSLQKNLPSYVSSSAINETASEETTVISQCHPAVLPVLEDSYVRSAGFPSHFGTEAVGSTQVSIPESFSSVLRDLTNLNYADTVTTDSRQGTSSTGEQEKTAHRSDGRQKKKRMKRTLPHSGQKIAVTSSLEESDSDRNFEGSDKRTALIYSKPQNRKHRSLQSSSSQSSASSPSQSKHSNPFDAQNFVQHVKERLRLVRGLASSTQAPQLPSSRPHVSAHTPPERITSADRPLVASRSPSASSAVQDITACSHQTPSWEGLRKSPMEIHCQNRSPLMKVKAELPSSGQDVSHKLSEQPGCSATVLEQAGYGKSKKEDGFSFQNGIYPATFQLKKDLGVKCRSWSTWSCGNIADDRTDVDAVEGLGSGCPDDADRSFSLLTSCLLPHQNRTLKLLKTNRTWPSHLNQYLSSSSLSSSSISSLFSQSDSEENSNYESQGKTVCGNRNSEGVVEGMAASNDEVEALVTPLDGSAVESVETEKKTDAAEITFQTRVPEDPYLQCGRESGLSTLYRELYDDEEADSDEEWKFLARVVNIDFDAPGCSDSTAKDKQETDFCQWSAEHSYSSDDQENSMLDASVNRKSALPAHRRHGEINSKWFTSKSPSRLQKRLECHSPDGSEMQCGWFDSLERPSSSTEPTSEWWHSMKNETTSQYNSKKGDTCDTLTEDESRSCDVHDEDSGASLPFSQSAGEVTGFSEWMSVNCASISCPGAKWPDAGQMSSNSTDARRRPRRGNMNKSGLCSDEEEEDIADGNSTDENYEGDTELDCECGGCDMTLHGDHMQVAGLSLGENISSSSPSGAHVQASLPGSEGVSTEEQNAAFGASGCSPEFQNLPRNPRRADFARQSMEDRHLEGAAVRHSRPRGGIQSNRSHRPSSEEESTARDSDRQSTREGQQSLLLTGNVLEDVDLLGSFLSSHWEELSYHMSIVDRFIEAFAACLSDAPRLTDEELQHLSSLPATTLEEGDTCAICLGNIQLQEMVIRLPTCCHLFHTICITKWLSTSRSCPVCRTVVQVYPSASSPTISVD